MIDWMQFEIKCHLAICLSIAHRYNSANIYLKWIEEKTPQSIQFQTLDEITLFDDYVFIDDQTPMKSIHQHLQSYYLSHYNIKLDFIKNEKGYSVDIQYL
jgi:hypothetical protein